MRAVAQDLVASSCAPWYWTSERPFVRKWCGGRIGVAPRSRELNGRNRDGARDGPAWKRVEGDRDGRAGGRGVHGLRNDERPAEDGDRRAGRRGGRRPDRGGGRRWRLGDRRERHRRCPRGWARRQPPR